VFDRLVAHGMHLPTLAGSELSYKAGVPPFDSGLGARPIILAGLFLLPSLYIPVLSIIPDCKNPNQLYLSRLTLRQLAATSLISLT
jgi:hypothetical protein